jgi:hypothetical protein
VSTATTRDRFGFSGRDRFMLGLDADSSCLVSHNRVATLAKRSFAGRTQPAQDNVVKI